MLINFFLECSGVNRDILKDCPTEQTKFVGIGATIFFTAVLAGISGGYAIFFTFNNFLITLVFGLLWGFIIFNLDRYIVSSIKKTGKFREEFLTALPRFIIAFVLAITISKPLEIKLFDGTIKKKLGETESNYTKKGEDDFNKTRDELNGAKAQLQTELENKRNSIYQNDPIYNDFINQRTGKQNEIDASLKQINDNLTIINRNSWPENIVNTQTGQTRRIRKYNQIASNKIRENRQLDNDIASKKDKINILERNIENRKSELANQVKQIEKQYEEQITGVQNQINDLNAKRPAIFFKISDEAASDKDILSRLRALSELKKFGNSVWFASLLITILFIFLECAPITVKLLSKRGPYDEILDRIEYEIYLSQQRTISKLNDEVNNELQTLRDANKLKRETQEKLDKIKFEKEISTNESIINDIADGQINLGKALVDKWYKDQLSKVK